MNETSTDAVLTAAVESPVSAPSASTAADEEAKRRRIISKLWGKGNKLSHKVRELDKCPMLNSSDSSMQHETEAEPSSLDLQKNPQSHSSADEGSNSINTNKPFAVVKPIILVKSGLIVAQASERTRVNSEANSAAVPPTGESSTTKKKKTHKNGEPRKKKASRSASKERTRSHHHHHHQSEASSSKTSVSDHQKSSHNTAPPRSSSKKDESSSSKTSVVSPNARRRSKTKSSANHSRNGPSNASGKHSESSTQRSDAPSDHHKTRSIDEKPSSSSRPSTSASKKDELPHRSTRKPIEPSSSTDQRTKNTHEKDSSRGSSIPANHDNDHQRRRKSSPDLSRHHRRESPARYDRHRPASPHSYYSNAHHVYHHHHHYRSSSSRYHHRRRSISPRSRYFSRSASSSSSSSSSSLSSSSRSSSSYSSVSRTSSSSRSRSRNTRYYRQKKFRRSPTLEKLFLKASESIESVSTRKNPVASTHLIPVQTSSTANTFYAESFSGFSAPPPPFLSQPQQRFLKEITTDSSTAPRPIFNSVSTPSIKASSSEDLSVNQRSSVGVRPPRVSRFSDITPAASVESRSDTDISVDTHLNYVQITENINCLSSPRRQQKRHNREVMECECTTNEYDRARGIKACGSECLNRMLLIECGPMCPCRNYCTNRRFQRRSYASHKLTLFKTEMKGYGIRTTGSIRKGRFLVEYVGEVIDMDELARRNKKYKREGQSHQYVMSLIHGTVIDSTIKGNWARFINHSCEPNCAAEKWLVNGEYRMGLFAKRDLLPGEEITIDYRFETFGTVDLATEKCYCGAATCRGTISVRNNNAATNNKRQNRRQPLDDDELLVYLRDETTNDYLLPKTIDEIRQLIQIMSRTDSENVRTIELDLIRSGSQKQAELPRLFLECNGLHVLGSWMKDILVDNDQQHDEQQYSNEFQSTLLDFIHRVLPIKDRTTVIKNGLLDLIETKLKLPSANQFDGTDDHQQINQLVDSMLDHLDDPIIAKLFDLHATWISLKERYIIPKRKEPQPSSMHHHHHHHHRHSSKHDYEEENNHRYQSSSRLATVPARPIDRPTSRRSFGGRDLSRTHEHQLSKDERRRLFEQQYEDEEKARAASTATTMNSESPDPQNEPPYKKQRISSTEEPLPPMTPPQSQESAMIRGLPNALHTDQMYVIHQHLSQIPIDCIRSYMASIDPSSSTSDPSNQMKDEVFPPPARPENESECSRIIRLPPGWSVALCPSDSSVYFYNQQTKTSSWTPPIAPLSPPARSRLDLSPLSSAHVTKQGSSSSRLLSKASKHPHRHLRTHRSHHHHHYHPLSSISSNTKRKRPSATDSLTQPKEEVSSPIAEEVPLNTSHEIESHPAEEEPSAGDSKAPLTDPNETEMSSTVKSKSEGNDFADEQTSSFKVNRDLLRKNISQHVHITLKPHTKRTCKQGRIVSTEDIKYLVKKFTLAVLDKEIEKAKNDGLPLAPTLTDRVRLKTEVYVKKYMNKVGAVFQRHEHLAVVHPPPNTNPE